MEKYATILIPDISGYTQLFSRTDLDFSTGVLCELLNELISVASEEFRVAEIEGDAILFYIKGKRLSAEELVDYCLKAYIHFHEYLVKLTARIEDPETRAAAELLTIKYIAHWGAIGEINIANFSKPVGLSLIKTHKLLKNSIKSRSYILMTDEFAEGQQLPKELLFWPEPLEWKKGKEDYPVIGEVTYQYALLESVEETKVVEYTI